MARRRRALRQPPQAETYKHPTADSPLRPDVGTQAQFRKKKPPATYRYDSSLSPALDWDGLNPAREQGEACLRQILEARSLDEARGAAAKLKVLGRPFLNWAGKAERLSFDVPTLPLFVHERLSTRAIIETLTGHKRPEMRTLFDLFADPQHPVTDQILKAYEHRDQWVNRLILGDSLVVMNSLLHYESLGGQVQMIYMDPPYGIKYDSNFQQRVDSTKNNEKEHADDILTIKAFRDTWAFGIHSYLSYLQERLYLSRELLATAGSIFLQMGDENAHLTRALLDEVFGASNFIA
jgi:adenine-specific DNA-methyltransferase